MLDSYDSFGHEALEVMVLDCDVLCERSNLQGDCDCEHTLILFMHNDHIKKNTGFYLGEVIFKF